MYKDFEDMILSSIKDIEDPKKHNESKSDTDNDEEKFDDLYPTMSH
jgi:hypothetical protein